MEPSPQPALETLEPSQLTTLNNQPPGRASTQFGSGKNLPRILPPGLRLSLRNIKGQWIVSALFFLLGSISTKRSHGQIPEFSSPGCGNMYMGGPAPRIN
ncbi:hypothetical protein M431DRAFT_494383 [Trichoderma harzianum CBS 226.95]|uniref:Uncharacterized protein n=1 Tax=Trichoderma harzianum CBS 226.95 TaxID=983964 RepID=A0A2T4AFS5_TRIHA|nr:hypothetical protein M431DRAFT_494383 [Trichoderma harzianum CBS 226.95]PTB55940.1 hypothetical protein M431DRAFT_494383 [Trichoderma harzianum CBS 226.95]